MRANAGAIGEFAKKQTKAEIKKVKSTEEQRKRQQQSRSVTTTTTTTPTTTQEEVVSLTGMAKNLDFFKNLDFW
jgi:hypothetical protein